MASCLTNTEINNLIKKICKCNNDCCRDRRNNRCDSRCENNCGDRYNDGYNDRCNDRCRCNNGRFENAVNRPENAFDRNRNCDNDYDDDNQEYCGCRREDNTRYE